MSKVKKPTKGPSLLTMNAELLVIVHCVERRQKQIDTLMREVTELMAKATALNETISALEKSGVRL